MGNRHFTWGPQKQTQLTSPLLIQFELHVNPVWTWSRISLRIKGSCAALVPALVLLFVSTACSSIKHKLKQCKQRVQKAPSTNKMATTVTTAIILEAKERENMSLFPPFDFEDLVVTSSLHQDKCNKSGSSHKLKASKCSWEFQSWRANVKRTCSISSSATEAQTASHATRSPPSSTSQENHSHSLKEDHPYQDGWTVVRCCTFEGS